MDSKSELRSNRRSLIRVSVIVLCGISFDGFASGRVCPGQESRLSAEKDVSTDTSVSSEIGSPNDELPADPDGPVMDHRAAAIRRGSRTAIDGFRNEDEIRERLNNWQTDPEAALWLNAMGYQPAGISHAETSKPHGEKTDVEVLITCDGRLHRERISIKLVSSARGFNQIDKRWLAAYAAMWDMPEPVRSGLSLYVGETRPETDGRTKERLFLDELPESSRDAIVAFFTDRKTAVVRDLIAGRGEYAADWMLVTRKTSDTTDYVMRPVSEVISYYSEGPVSVTRAGNLKIGRISMQRKGGDNGRPTADMLQFKMNPAELFDMSAQGKEH